MKTRMLFFTGLMFFCTLNPGCNKSSSLDVVHVDFIELIKNTSFEVDGNPTLQGWKVDNTLQCILVNQAPPGGGLWSLKINAEWTYPHYARIAVAPSEGTHEFKCSFLGKRFNISGGAELFIRHSDSLILRKQMVVSDTSWTLYSFTDTISIHKPDSLVIKLTGGTAPWQAGFTTYDLISLKQSAYQVPLGAK